MYLILFRIYCMTSFLLFKIVRYPSVYFKPVWESFFNQWYMLLPILPEIIIVHQNNQTHPGSKTKDRDTPNIPFPIEKSAEIM